MPDCRQSTMQIKLVLVTFKLQPLGWWLTHFLFCKLVLDETDYTSSNPGEFEWSHITDSFKLEKKNFYRHVSPLFFFLMTNLIHVWYSWEMCLWCDEASELVREGSYFCLNSRLVTMESLTPKFSFYFRIYLLPDLECNDGKTTMKWNLEHSFDN